MRKGGIVITAEMYERASELIDQDCFGLRAALHGPQFRNPNPVKNDLPLSPYLISELWRAAIEDGRRRGHGKLKKLVYREDGRVVGYFHPNLLTLDRVEGNNLWKRLP